MSARRAGLGLQLRLPPEKLVEIKEQHSIQTNRTRAVVKYWLSVDPTPTWKRLLEALERSKEHQAVERVRPYMEPLTGEHCIATIGISGESEA